MFRLKRKQKSNIKKIAKINGKVDYILPKSIEELEELVAVLKDKHINTARVADEVADVVIVLSQLMHYYKLGGKVSKNIDYKTNRTIDLIGRR